MLKKNMYSIIFALFFICLVLFPTSNLHATQNGILLWTKSIVPSLLPFFIATELLNHTNLPYYIGKLTNKLMRPLFNVPGIASYAFIMGIISGYPVGAKIINSFVDDGYCTKQEAERMLAFTNNSSPLFIIGTIGITMFGSTQIGIVLFITHVLSCITVGIIFGFFSKRKTVSNVLPDKTIQPEKNLQNIGAIISTSITNSISTILLIGGFIVLFSIIISILYSLNIIQNIASILSLIGINTEYSNGIICGLIELTNGINAISLIHTKYMSHQIIMTAFLLGCAGLSIFLQVFSIAQQKKLQIKYYFFGKLLQGFIAAFYTFIILHYFDFINLDLIQL